MVCRYFLFIFYYFIRMATVVRFEPSNSVSYIDCSINCVTVAKFIMLLDRFAKISKNISTSEMEGRLIKTNYMLILFIYISAFFSQLKQRVAGLEP